eukprot:CAMPEP_0194490840 /NCGR_PEP_ID=MMETSP0253-20130528/9919_1 /TAXON_ID=2966 /ORGANISM="Noctiluca scintillans" /LENGTH=254 /DNA_ID=CAMNT_0039331515 /DNA_START=17 /DNA_END=781 /DNA_ORIENTATION=+
MSTWLWRLVVIVAAAGVYGNPYYKEPWDYRGVQWDYYYSGRHYYYFYRGFQWDYVREELTYVYQEEFDYYYLVPTTAAATTSTTSTTAAAMTDAAPTVRGTISMFCSPTDKDIVCSDANLSADGTTHSALYTSLSVSAVDMSSASIGALSCSDRRLTEASERRLAVVNFTLSYAASFINYLAAATFFIDVTTESSNVANAFEDQLSADLGVDVVVTVNTPKVTGTTEIASAARDTFYIFSIFVSLVAPMLVLGL